MAYDIKLEGRIDLATEQWEEPLVKKKMFGGVGYMIYGNMAFGVHKDMLLIRAADEQGSELLKQEGINPFDMGGKTMGNWFLAGPEAIAEDYQLAELLVVGRDFALALPPK